MTSYENSSGVPRQVSEPDAHGQAALLLAESILHALVERSILSVTDAVSVVQTASEVKIALALEGGETRDRAIESLNLLSKISDSLSVDLRPDV
jgi:hypothetical protein